jgi:small subunit ribosomal protein S21
MAIVNVNQGESIESALRRFKRRVMTEEIIKDAKKHAFFMRATNPDFYNSR